MAYKICGIDEWCERDEFEPVIFCGDVCIKGDLKVCGESDLVITGSGVGDCCLTGTATKNGSPLRGMVPLHIADDVVTGGSPVLTIEFDEPEGATEIAGAFVSVRFVGNLEGEDEKDNRFVGSDIAYNAEYYLTSNSYSQIVSANTTRSGAQRSRVSGIDDSYTIRPQTSTHRTIASDDGISVDGNALTINLELHRDLFGDDANAADLCATGVLFYEVCGIPQQINDIVVHTK